MRGIIVIARLLTVLIISILTCKICKMTFSDKKVSRFLIKRVENELRKNKFNKLSYKYLERYLKENGITEMFETRVITPPMFVLLKIFLALILSLVGITEQIWWLAIALAIVGYYIPELIVKMSNNSDNDQFLDDLQNVYDTLRIQTKAGVYLAHSLGECYLVVKNKRLKKAILELSNQILGKNDIESSIEEFNSKFNSKYIDTFCVVIKQSLENGKTVQVLEDLSVQIKDIQHAITLKEEEKMKNKLEMLQVLIFIGVMGIVLFGLIKELSSMLVGF